MAFLDAGSRSAAPSVDTEGKLRNELLGQIANILRTLLPRMSGSFTLAAAATTVVPQTGIASTSVIALTPTNAAAAALMAGAKSLYVSAKTQGASFTVATADASAAAGTETFNYLAITPV